MDERLVQAAVQRSLVGGDHPVNDITVIRTCQAARGVDHTRMPCLLYPERV